MVTAPRSDSERHQRRALVGVTGEGLQHAAACLDGRTVEPAGDVGEFVECDRTRRVVGLADVQHDAGRLALDPCARSGTFGGGDGSLVEIGEQRAFVVGEGLHRMVSGLHPV